MRPAAFQALERHQQVPRDVEPLLSQGTLERLGHQAIEGVVGRGQSEYPLTRRNPSGLEACFKDEASSDSKVTLEMSRQPRPAAYTPQLAPTAGSGIRSGIVLIRASTFRRHGPMAE